MPEPPMGRPQRQRRLYGRDADLAVLDARARGSRLVTVVGPPGVGKTRLVMEHGLRLSDGGTPVSFFDFAHVSPDSDAIAIALGAESMADLHRVISARHGAEPSLVILDTCDRILGSLLSVVRLFELHAPNAQLMITSRARLRAPGESVFELSPLTCAWAKPGDEPSAAQELLLDASERAGRAPSTDAELRHAADLVEALDGIPLALDLAAVRIATVGVGHVLRQLRSGLDVLDAVRQDAPQRHASWRSAVEWSWSSLTDAEQATFAQVSVFRGGFSLDAAEAIVELPPDRRRSSTSSRRSGTSRFSWRTRDPVASCGSTRTRWSVSTGARNSQRSA